MTHYMKKDKQFINDLSQCEMNVDGIVEDGLQMLEKYFLVESNTAVNVVAIKGGPGIGKTHLCRELSRRLLKKIQETGSRQIAIPIMVEMIEVENVGQHLDLEAFLNNSIERYAFRSTKEIAYLKNSIIPKVIILDGLSEWAWGSPAISIRDWIRLREWKNTKLIITYRRPFVRAEEFPYFFGLKCKQLSELNKNNQNQNGSSSRDNSPIKKAVNIYQYDNSEQVDKFGEDDREKCFEVFQLLSLSQDGVEDYIRQKEVQVREDVKGKERRESMSLNSSFASITNMPQIRNKSLSIIKEIEPGFLLNIFRACTRQNTHLIDMLELPFNLFCFAEILAKAQGIKEIYWGGGGTREERKQAATWFTNIEEMQEKLFVEEINGLIAEAEIDDNLRDVINENCIEFFQSLAMNLFVERKYKVALYNVQNLMNQQMKTILRSGATKQEINAFEKIIVTIIQNIQRTSFLTSSDISFFSFVNAGSCNEEEMNENMQEVGSFKEFELNFGQQKGGQTLSPTSQLYSFRNTPWLEFLIARAMKYDFDKVGNKLHSIALQDLQKFAINTRYLLQERSVSEHNPFSLSQQTHHASVEMNILKKLATIIRKDLLDQDFLNKLSEKEISYQHRYIQMIQKTRRRPKKFYQNQQPGLNQPNLKNNQAGLEEWVIKHQKHPLDIASSNLLSAICLNKLTLSNIKLRNCSFSRSYLYGYRGDLDIACSDVSESNLRGSFLNISRSKYQNCLQDDEKNNHELWNSAHAYSYSAINFATNNKLICGSLFGGLSVFQPNEQKVNSDKNKKLDKKKQKKDQEQNITNTLSVTDPNFKPTQFWQMQSYQRHFQDEIRAIVYFQGDIYYAFLNVIAHVTEQGEEKELVIGHQNKINDMCISEKHSTLATVSSDHTIRIWGIINPEQAKKQGKKQQQNQKQNQSQNVNRKIGYTNMVPKDGYDDEYQDEEQKDEDVEESFAEMELLHTLNRHEAEVLCCSYSPDGKYLATGSYDQLVLIWDISSQYQKTIQLSIKSDWILSLQFSHDSKMLVAGSSQSYVKIWDASKDDFPDLQIITTRRQRRDSMILGNPINKNDCIGGISCVRFSPNSKLLVFATFDEPGLQVWELIKKSSPKQFMPSSTNKIFLDDSVMSQEYTTQRMSYFLVNSFSFSPDGKHIAISSQNQTICSIWDVDENFVPPKQSKNGSEQHQHQDKPSALKLKSVISPNKVAALAITHDGRYMATCAGLASPHKDSCRITIWCMMKKGEQAMIMQILDTGLHSQAITCLCFSPDNQYLVSGSEDEHFVVWKNVSGNLEGGTLFSRQASHDSRRFSAMPNTTNTRGSVTITSNNQTSQFMRLEPFKQVSAHKGSISSIAFSSDNRFLVTSSVKEKSCKVWDGHTFDFSHQIQWEEELQICKLEFSSNGLYLATLPLPTVSTNTISTVYQNRKGSKKLTVQKKMSMIKTENSQLYEKKLSIKSNNASQRSSCCFLWNANERFSYHGIVGTVKNKEGRAFTTQIISMCFSKDSQMFATGQTNGLINIWNASDRFHFIQSVDAHFSGITHITFSGDSQMLASTAFDQTCKIWHIPNRFHEVSSFYVPPETQDIQFVRQGHSIAVASSSDEFCLKFVDVYAPNFRIEELRAHSGPISQVTFSNDGRFLLTASTDNTVRIWDLKNYFFQHYTINLNFRQHITQKSNNHNTLSKQEQKQDDDQLEQKRDFYQEDEEQGDDRYKNASDSPIKRKKNNNIKNDLILSIEDPDEDEILEIEKNEVMLNQNSPQNKKEQQKKGKQNRKQQIFAAPNLKPSQLYQQKIKEIHKDENINEEDYDDNIGGIIAAAISEKGTFVFVVTKEESQYVQLYDFTRGVDDVRESIILKDHTDSITCLALSVKDEFIATGCANTEIRIWKRTSLSPLTCEFGLEKVIEGRHTKAISCVAFSPNLKYFASGSWDITTKVYDVENNFSLVHVLDGQYGYILSVCFSPCSSRLSITSRDNSVYVWDLENRLVQEEFLDNHRQAVTTSSYSRQYLATASKDQSFVLYDIKDEYKLFRKIENLPSPVTNSNLSPDGKYLVIGLQNSLVQIWDLLNIFDLTSELMSDPMYLQVLEMEKQLKVIEGEIDPEMGSCVCNFLNEEDIKEDQKNSHPDGEANQDDMLKQIPTMKNDIISSILKSTYEQYRESNNLQFDIQHTQDNRILVSVSKYPICAVTL